MLRLADRNNRNAKQIALVPRVHYDLQMHDSSILCDGCGQEATAEHIARRLKRLEKMTRYRPIHVQALLVGAASPEKNDDDLYSAEHEFRGEGANVLRALGIVQSGRSVEEVLAGIQRQGILLTHVLECPVSDVAAKREAMRRRLPSILMRIRRSYKPKLVLPIGEELCEFVTQITNARLDAVIVLKLGQPLDWGDLSAELLGKEAAAPL